MNIAEVRSAVDRFHKHNNEQKVIIGVNEPRLNQCREWVEKMSGMNSLSPETSAVLEQLKAYLEKGKGLRELKIKVEETLGIITKKKLEELDAYRY